MPRLIVNADDFGLTRGVNRAIGDLAEAGAVTSTTLMANAPEAADAASTSKNNHRLGVGCHLVLVDGNPIAPPEQVASLLEPGTGRFYATLGAFVRALFRGRIRGEHLVTEATAQIRRVRELGIAPTHVDTHKHTHMFPQVLEAVLHAARTEGVSAVRNPFEPAWAMACGPRTSRVRKLEVTTLSRLYRKQFLRAVESHSMLTTDGALGVAATGTLDEKTLDGLMKAIPEGTWELVCHPGYVDEALKKSSTRLRESRATEAQSLFQMHARLTSAVQLIHFGDLRA